MYRCRRAADTCRLLTDYNNMHSYSNTPHVLSLTAMPSSEQLYHFLLLLLLLLCILKKCVILFTKSIISICISELTPHKSNPTVLKCSEHCDLITQLVTLNAHGLSVTAARLFDHFNLIDFLRLTPKLNFKSL